MQSRDERRKIVCLMNRLEVVVVVLVLLVMIGIKDQVDGASGCSSKWCLQGTTLLPSLVYNCSDLECSLGCLEGNCELNCNRMSGSSMCALSCPGSPNFECREQCSSNWCGLSCDRGGCQQSCYGTNTFCGLNCYGGRCAQRCEDCRKTCLGGSCVQSCSGGHCVDDCYGGACRQDCAEEGCTQTCFGGNCEQACRGGACRAFCSGGYCTQWSNGLGLMDCWGGYCEQTCYGDGCEMECIGGGCNQTCYGSGCSFLCSRDCVQMNPLNASWPSPSSVSDPSPSVSPSPTSQTPNSKNGTSLVMPAPVPLTTPGLLTIEDGLLLLQDGDIFYTNLEILGNITVNSIEGSIHVLGDLFLLNDSYLHFWSGSKPIVISNCLHLQSKLQLVLNEQITSNTKELIFTDFSCLDGQFSEIVVKKDPDPCSTITPRAIYERSSISVVFNVEDECRSGESLSELYKYIFPALGIITFSFGVGIPAFYFFNKYTTRTKQETF